VFDGGVCPLTGGAQAAERFDEPAADSHAIDPSLIPWRVVTNGFAG
jgi:hypothetical protein